jgi:gliding motility-associated-like protein
MKTKMLLLICALGVSQYLLAQSPANYSSSMIDARQADEQKAREFFIRHNFNTKDYDEYITSWRKQHDGSYQRVSQPVSPASPMAACTNVDFEQGSLNGWTPSTGYHPLYNPIGCCPMAGGAQAVTSGAGLDPFGLFPIVCPGGNYSLQLGNSSVGGIADRIEQTFMVTSSNSNYSYKYAVVLEDPGHPVSQQPAFTIEMVDSNGNQIPCTYYDVAAGQGIPGFQNSTVQSDVVFKPWTTVAVNLTAYIGQNVTIRFTTYDCALGGHFGYAYIDGSCQSFQIIQNNTLCSNSTTQICAPAGFAAYSWTGPGVVNGAGTSCATVNAGGMYNVQLTTVTGCSSPISFNVTSVQAPTASFITTNQTCNSQLAYTNTSIGTGLTSLWNFGDGGISTQYSPTHIYAGPGNYPTTMVIYSTNGCSDTTQQMVTVYPKPSAQFVFNTACANNTVNFNNMSSVSTGTIVSNKWAFGDGGTSLLTSPAHVYALGGNYNVQLTVTDNNTCKDSLIKSENIFNLPVAAFNAQAVCQGNNTAFNNTSSVTGSTLTGYAWDFTDDGIIDNTTQNPTAVYPASGTYSVMLQVTSAQGCVNHVTNTVTVNPNPVVVFSVNNACMGGNFLFNNTSTIVAGNIVQSTWSFGDGTNSSQTAPQHVYSTANTYAVTLTETSNYGCVSSLNQNVTAYPKPILNFAVNPVCQLQSSIFNNSSTIPSGSITTWNWDFTSDGVIDNTTQNPTYTYSQGGSFNCTLHATSNEGCTDSLTKSVTVYFNPVADFKAPSVCAGTATQFTDMSTSQSGTITGWDWDYTGNGTFDNVSQNPSTVYTGTGLFLVTLQVQTNYGCMSSVKKPVHINPVPTSSFAVTQKAGCPDNMCVGMINNSTIQGGSIAHWLWNFGDNSVSSTQNSPVHCFKPGTYNISLMVISDSGCTSSATLNNAITVYPKPVAGFTYTPGDADIIDPTVSIINRAEGANGYLYFISDGFAISGHPDFTHEFPNENGQSYTVLQVVTNSYGCRDSVEEIIKINPAYTFYIPNAFTPNGDGTNEVFKGTGIGIKSYTLMIFDRWGELIFQSDDIEQGWNGTFKDKGGQVVQEGVYVWKVQLRDEKNREHDFDGTVSVIK